MGLGLIAFGLALLPFVLGAVLALYGVKRIGPKGFWITLVSMGVTPALILVCDYILADRTTTWIPDGYLEFAAFFGVIALIGIVWGVFDMRRMSKPRT